MNIQTSELGRWALLILANLVLCFRNVFQNILAFFQNEKSVKAYLSHCPASVIFFCFPIFFKRFFLFSSLCLICFENYWRCYASFKLKSGPMPLLRIDFRKNIYQKQSPKALDDYGSMLFSKVIKIFLILEITNAHLLNQHKFNIQSNYKAPQK